MEEQKSDCDVTRPNS